jgi:FkbM family methyltransferase
MCRVQARPLYLGDHIAISRILGRYKIFFDTRDYGFSSHVLLDGYWEMWLTIFICQRIKPGMTVMDIGANFGYYTVLLADLVGVKGRVFAIEPNPRAATLLRQSVLLNGFSRWTSVVEAAAGAEAATALLYSPHGEFKNACIIDSAELVDRDAGTLHHVQQVKVDQLIGDEQGVDFLKIDAEGSEELIVKGMDHCIQVHRPSLVVEFNAARGKEPAAMLNYLISAYGKVFYLDFKSNLIRTTEAELLSVHVGQDWLLFFDRDTAKT